MAVEDKYVDSNVVDGDKQDASYGVSGVRARIATEETAAADDDGSVYRFFKGVPVSEVLVDLILDSDAITGGTDFEIGMYETDTGAVIDQDNLLGTIDLSSAKAAVNGMTAVDAANIGKTIKGLIEAGGGTVTYPTVDICVTANTVGSGVGTITLRLLTK
jgi:hypothetical protein